MTSPERRRHPRTPPAGNFVISCYRAEWTGQTLDNYNMANKIFDLGPKGAKMLTRLKVAHGVPLVVDINVPYPKSRFKALAVVRWTKEVELDNASKRKAYETGLEFEKLLDADGETGEYLASGLGGIPKKPASRRNTGRFAPPSHDAEVYENDFKAMFGFHADSLKELKDLSQGGAQIVTTRELKVGRKVTLTLRFQAPRTVLRLQGEVRWCRRIPGIVERLWRSGIAFRNLSQADQQNLQALSIFAK